MKKVLAVLASLTLTSSAVFSVVACTTEPSNEKINQEFELNNLNNLVGAISNEAKAIILDNEFGLGQDATKKILNNQSAKEIIDGFDPSDTGLNNNSIMKNVVDKYLMASNNNYVQLNSENVKLGNKKGVSSGLESILPEFITDLLKEYEKFLPLIKPILNQIKNNLTGPNMIGFFNEAASGSFSNPMDLILNGLQFINAKPVIDDLKKIKNPISVFFQSLFKNETIQILRGLSNDLLDENSTNYLTNYLYNQSADSSIKSIGDIKVADVKTEIMLSVGRIFKSIYIIPEETGEFFKTIEPGSSQEVSLIFANLLSNSITGTSWQTNPLDQKLLSPVMLEIFRIITILNAYWSFFETTRTNDFKVKDSQHLFSDELNNYQFISQNAGGKTLNDSVYVQDKAINISYFLTNLNYYFGSLINDDDQSLYRFQQGTFLLLNDPVENYSEPAAYGNKPSTLLNQFLDVMLLLGIKSTSDIPQETLIKMFNNPLNKQTILNTTIKPLVLGFSNGDDIETILALVKGTINGLVKLVPNLIFFKDYLDDMVKILDEVQKLYPRNTFNSLLKIDLRPIFKNNVVINSDLLNRWFDIDQKINLQTLLTQPITKMLGVFNVSWFDETSNLGESFLTQNLPQLINLITNYFNKIKPELNVSTIVYNTGDELTSLKTLNLDLPTVHQFIAKIIGDEKGKGNLFSTIVESIFSDGDNEWTKRLGLNFEALAKNLGYVNENEFKSDSFVGLLIKTFLPLTQKKTGETIKLEETDYGVDLLGMWLRNLFDIVEKLATPVNYDKTINQILNLDNTFKIKINPRELTYFTKYSTNQIQTIGLDVRFLNPMNLIQTKYLFRLERIQPGTKFDFTKITTDKIMKGAN